MKTKQYNLYKTIAKTARENNLTRSTRYNDILFDFSALSGSTISGAEQEIIREDALDYICMSCKDSFYGSNINQFSYCDGQAHYIMHPVYNAKTGKRLYVIAQLSSFDHINGNRNSIYDDYTCTKYHYSDGYTEPMIDIEI